MAAITTGQGAGAQEVAAHALSSGVSGVSPWSVSQAGGHPTITSLCTKQSSHFDRVAFYIHFAQVYGLCKSTGESDSEWKWACT